MEHHISLTADELELSAVLHYPAAADEKGNLREHSPLIVICHGFVGDKIGENRLFVAAARRFSELGFMVLRSDYGGCGESSGDYGTGGLARLIAETRRVIDYGISLDAVDPGRIILLGHSLGGAVALLTAAADKRIKTLVLWSAAAHPHGDLVRIVGKDVYNAAINGKTADYLGYGLTAGFFASLSAYKPLEAAQQFGGDVLLVHGTSDDEIPVEYCFLYQRVFWLRSYGKCDKEVLQGADHTYSAGEWRETAIAKTAEWLLSGGDRRTDWDDWVI